MSSPPRPKHYRVIYADPPCKRIFRGDTPFVSRFASVYPRKVSSKLKPRFSQNPRRKERAVRLRHRGHDFALNLRHKYMRNACKLLELPDARVAAFQDARLTPCHAPFITLPSSEMGA